jgi:hypothetical protein
MLTGGRFVRTLLDDPALEVLARLDARVLVDTAEDRASPGTTGRAEPVLALELRGFRAVGTNPDEADNFLAVLVLCPKALEESDPDATRLVGWIGDEGALRFVASEARVGIPDLRAGDKSAGRGIRDEGACMYQSPYRHRLRYPNHVLLIVCHGERCWMY